MQECAAIQYLLLLWLIQRLKFCEQMQKKKHGEKLCLARQLGALCPVTCHAEQEYAHKYDGQRELSHAERHSILRLS